MDETRSVHLKVYIEPSVFTLLKKYQIRTGIYSMSEAARNLIIQSLEHEPV